MREALMLQLEKFCYYQHLSLTGGQDRPIFCCRIVDIRGTRFHVLSRIKDAGLDFTGRTNFIAHHLAFTPEEIRQFPTPPVILLNWPGWMKSWTKDPQLLESEDWTELTALAGSTNIPAQAWQQVTGDAVNALGLLEARAGASFRVDDLPDDTVLELVAESLEMLEIRDTRRDFRSAAWNYTFTTSMQEQDNPADFRWRCFHSDHPTANRFAAPDCRALSAVRATKFTGEETAFARTGRQPPRFVTEPQDIRITEGQVVRFTAKADAVPAPIYQWYKCDKDGKEIELLKGEASNELSLSDPPLGVSRYRVWATNSQNNSQSRLAVLSVEKKIRLAQTRSDSEQRVAARTVPYQKSEDEIEKQRNQLGAEEAAEAFHTRHRKTIILIATLVVASVAIAGIVREVTSSLKKSMAKLSAELNGQGTTTPAASPSPANTPSSDSSDQPALVKPPTNNTNVTSRNPPEKQTVNPPLAEFSLPPGWTAMVIGSASNIHAEYINVKHQPRFDLSAAATGFSINGDNVLFICETNSGSEFNATLKKIDSPIIENKCGVMIRASQKGDSPFLFIGASSEMITTYRRDENNEFFSNEIKMPKDALGMPVFLKFDQIDKQYIPSYSFDAKTWGTFTNSTMHSSTRTVVGFAICSGSASSHVTAHFVDVSSNMTRP